MHSPSEVVIAGLIMAGMDEDEAREVARTALGALVAGGYVLKVRGGPEVDAERKESGK